MNKIIKELLKQSDPSCTEDYNEDVMCALQRFAESIIEECSKYLSNESERLYTLSVSEHRINFKENFESCAEKCLDNIKGLKEHFGIE